MVPSLYRRGVDIADLERVESALGLSLPKPYRDFLLDQSSEIRRLSAELKYVVAPWVDADELITGNREAVFPSANRFVVAGNGVGDYWFIESAVSESAIWFYEHETDETSRAYDQPADWIAYLRERVARQVKDLAEAAEKQEREFAELKFGAGGISTLYTAAQDVESTKRLEALIAAGHDVNTRNRNKSAGTPLQGAVGRGNLAAVRLLLAAGADPALAESNGNTVLHGCGKPEIAKLLLDAGGDPNARNELEGTPLHSCAFFGREEVTVCLLEQGADKTLFDQSDQTPLDVAKARNKSGMIALLSE